MEWKLSRRGKKVTYLVGFPVFEIVLLVILFIAGGAYKRVESWIIFLVVGITVIGLIEFIVYKIGQRVEAWDYPRIVKIEDNTLRILWHDMDKKAYVDKIRPINFDSIYQIVIRDKSFQMYYVLNGKKYLTGFALDGFFIRHITKEREKRLQILSEVLKRIDRSKVEIIDRTRRKKFKID